jgi:hypothetical protein
MKQRPYRVGGGKNPESFERDFQTGIEEIQLAVFESVLRSSLTLPLQEPPLGIRQETWPEKTRKWMQPMIDAAHAASVAAVKAAVKGVGPLSPMMAHYAAAARAQQARSASQKRVVRKGGRPTTVRWRRVVKAMLDKNSLLTASDLLDKLESRGVVQRDAGYVVFTDEHGLRTEGGSEERKFLNSLKTLKYQHLNNPK